MGQDKLNVKRYQLTLAKSKLIKARAEGNNIEAIKATNWVRKLEREISAIMAERNY